MFGDGFIPAHAGKTVGHRLQHQDRRAHPRSRGENGANVNGTSLPTGSSPLTRGKLVLPGWSARTRRLIPAHAGKTSTVSARPPRTGAHPRSRGENNRAVGTARTSSGSSPLTRGKPCRTGNTRPCLGLIPAHAGKTTGEALPTESRAAHPRSRGENGQWIAGIATEVGSSPLTRGKHSANR